ncbi:MAG: DNA-binding domain-containing protein [Sphingorhabdus sp.]
MPSLVEAQANFIATINDGPDALDPALFAGSPDRAILGLKAHANTISHARLVALEDTFPRCRQTIGEAEFNRLSRSFCDTQTARASDGNGIGAHFPGHLASEGIAAANIDLARIEWLWLTSYNAGEAETLKLADLAGLDEGALLDLPVTLHPATCCLTLSAPLSPAIAELQDNADADAVIITRPDTQPLLTPANALEASICTHAEKNATIGNLLKLVIEQGGENDALAPVISVINAGALIQMPQQGSKQGDER